MGENMCVSPDQISNVLGSDQVKSLAASLGLDGSQASGFLADYLPKIVDKLTPTGQVDDATDAFEGLAGLLPSLMSNMDGESKPG